MSKPILNLYFALVGIPKFGLSEITCTPYSFVTKKSRFIGSCVTQAPLPSITFPPFFRENFSSFGEQPSSSISIVSLIVSIKPVPVVKLHRLPMYLPGKH